MSDINIYKYAVVNKLRFTVPFGKTPSGVLLAEDLSDLPLTSTTKKVSLNDIAVDINKRIQEVSAESFVDDVPKSDMDLNVSLEIVKDIIAEKKAANKSKQEAIAKRQRKEQLEGLLAERKLDVDKSKSIEELEAELELLR